MFGNLRCNDLISILEIYLWSQNQKKNRPSTFLSFLRWCKQEKKLRTTRRRRRMGLWLSVAQKGWDTRWLVNSWLVNPLLASSSNCPSIHLRNTNVLVHQEHQVWCRGSCLDVARGRTTCWCGPSYHGLQGISISLQFSSISMFGFWWFCLPWLILESTSRWKLVKFDKLVGARC